MEAPDRPLFDFCDQLEAVIPLVHTVHDDRLTDHHQASDFYRLPPLAIGTVSFPAVRGQARRSLKICRGTVDDPKRRDTSP